MHLDALAWSYKFYSGKPAEADVQKKKLNRHTDAPAIGCANILHIRVNFSYSDSCTCWLFYLRETDGIVYISALSTSQVKSSLVMYILSRLYWRFMLCYYCSVSLELLEEEIWAHMPTPSCNHDKRRVSTPPPIRWAADLLFVSTIYIFVIKSTKSFDYNESNVVRGSAVILKRKWNWNRDWYY
jgi:hypothetical protein